MTNPYPSKFNFALTTAAALALTQIAQPWAACAAWAVEVESLNATAVPAAATIQAPAPVEEDPRDKKVFLEWSTYGSMHFRRFDYFKNAQDTNPRKRTETDLERFVFEPELEIGRSLKLEVELEFEHGGTGSTLEFDGFEEFGEFETETEQGGEVRVDKLELTYLDYDWLSYRFGYITVPVGMISQRHHPTEYFTVQRNRSEERILPSTWRSMGVGFFGDITHWLQYQAVIVQGLNSEFFRKYNWIQGGNRRAFETTYADNMAYAVRLDYGPDFPYRKFGASYFYGDSSGNRQKTDKLNVEAGVMIWDVHGIWESDTWTFRAMYLRGYLQNSEEVSAANKTLGGSASPGAFSSLGKEVEAAFAEVGYNLQNLAPSFFRHRLDLFLRYDTVDPMAEVAGSITYDPRFRDVTWTTGLNWKPRPELVAKLQYSKIKNGLPAIPEQEEIMAGLGFYYSTED